MKVHADEVYVHKIRDYLSIRAVAARADIERNQTSLSVLSEYFYCDFLNCLLDCKLINYNSEIKNAPGIDLIDRENRIAVQVSSTCDPQRIRNKIQNSIIKANLPEENWQFYYVPLTEDAPKPDIKVTKGLRFNPQKDILDISTILEYAQKPDADTNRIIDRIKRLADIVDEYSLSTRTSETDHHINNWVTTPYVPASRTHVRFKNEEEMIGQVLGKDQYAVSGTMGGIGKTELLRQICTEVLRRKEASYIGWIDYSGNIEADIQRAFIDVVEKTNPITSLLLFAQKQENRLVLFVDNVNINGEEKVVSLFSRLNCRVYVSTRNQEFLDYPHLYLDLFSEETALELFTNYRENRIIEANKYIEKRIVARCGYHPFAIELIAKYAKVRILSDEGLLSELDRFGFDLNALVQSNWNGNKPELITRQLENLYRFSELQNAEELLYLIKCFAIIPSYPHPTKIIDCILNTKSADFVCLQTLIDNGWLSYTAAGCYMHDLVKAIVDRNIDISTKDCESFLNKLCYMSTESSDSVTAMNTLPILLYIADKLSSQSKEAAVLKVANNISYLYYEVTDYASSVRWADKIIDLLEGSILNTKQWFALGLAYNNKGSAKHLQSKVEGKSGEEAISVVQEELNAYKKAIAVYESLIESKLVSRSELEAPILTVKNNIASALFILGKEKEAIDELLQICKKKIENDVSAMEIVYFAYSCLLEDDKHRNDKELTREKEYLEKLMLVFKKNEQKISFFSKTDDCVLLVENLDIEHIRTDWFTIVNESITSLLHSFDALGGYLASVMKKMIADGSAPAIDLYCLANRYINFALDICDVREKITWIEGEIFGTKAELLFLSQYIYPVKNAVDKATKMQMKGVKILEYLYEKTAVDNSKYYLIIAYERMYSFTKEECWLQKLNEIHR